MTDPNTRSKRILAVLAHPDDESFGMGGTLALYASRGVDITLACATLGEAGIIPEGMLQPGQTVADLRKAELECAIKALGVRNLILLGYRDSGMLGWEANKHPQALIAQPAAEIAQHVLKVMEAQQPHIVLTFDPIGGYRHPDHIHLQRATVAAFEQYRQSKPQNAACKLLFHLMPTALLNAAIFTLRLTGRDPRHYGDRGDIDLVDIAQQNFPRHYTIRYNTVAKQAQAARLCHLSQGGNNRGAEKVNFLMRLLDRPVDHFMQAWPQPLDGKRRQDLFEG
jgi:N-acetyl-1-D-myo-inositol-2-amino-2-deoxy-alpha-D-glucopyranoside deacetylase